MKVKKKKLTKSAKSSPLETVVSRKVVGWREWIGLPQMGVRQIKVKVDTGARTSALHVTHLVALKSTSKVQFKVHPHQDHHLPEMKVEAEVLEYRKVKSSNGEVSLRPVIQTAIRVGALEYPIELTLVNRDLMGFRMLLGRQALRGKFWVDPARSFLQPIQD